MLQEIREVTPFNSEAILSVRKVFQGPFKDQNLGYITVQHAIIQTLTAPPLTWPPS